MHIYDTRPAGPELDMMVAEIIGDDFGVRPLHDWRDAQTGYMCRRCSECHDWSDVSEMQRDFPGPCKKEPRNYSTDTSGLLWPRMLHYLELHGWGWKIECTRPGAAYTCVLVRNQHDLHLNGDSVSAVLARSVVAAKENS